MGASSSSDSFGSSSCSSNSSGSSSGKRKSGGQWTSKIYFDPEAEKNSGLSHYMIGDEELIEKLTRLVDSEEAIETVYAYKDPLNDWQLTSFTMYHLFIIFKTNKWWWSIEKHSDGITIQRSKQLSAVKSRYRQGSRTSISFVKQDSGSKSVEDLIRWLYQANELNKPYHYLASNCKTFAKRVFDHVARHTNLYWYDGAFS